MENSDSLKYLNGSTITSSKARRSSLFRSLSNLAERGRCFADHRCSSIERDPDDVYLSVEEREEERKKQGLPPRVGILPQSAVAAEEERWEAQQERKNQRAQKRRK